MIFTWLAQLLDKKYCGRLLVNYSDVCVRVRVLQGGKRFEAS